MNKLLKYWQNKLGLDDWKIELHTDCSPREMYDPLNDGQCQYHFVKKLAIIKICTEKDVSVDSDYNFERILVHELLHIKFAILDDSGNALQDKIVHQLVQDFANILTEGKHAVR